MRIREILSSRARHCASDVADSLFKISRQGPGTAQRAKMTVNSYMAWRCTSRCESQRHGPECHRMVTRMPMQPPARGSGCLASTVRIGRRTVKPDRPRGLNAGKTQQHMVTGCHCVCLMTSMASQPRIMNKSWGTAMMSAVIQQPSRKH